MISVSPRPNTSTNSRRFCPRLELLDGAGGRPKSHKVADPQKQWGGTTHDEVTSFYGRHAARRKAKCPARVRARIAQSDAATEFAGTNVPAKSSNSAGRRVGACWWWRQSVS